jgi:hypothetical protein
MVSDIKHTDEQIQPPHYAFFFAFHMSKEVFFFVGSVSSISILLQCSPKYISDLLQLVIRFQSNYVRTQ